MTFLFDGHGGPAALYLSDGQVDGLEPAGEQGIIETEKTIKITVDELSAALTKRSQRIGKEEVAKDILIFSACYNHTFLRSLSPQTILRNKWLKMKTLSNSVLRLDANGHFFLCMPPKMKLLSTKSGTSCYTYRKSTL